MNREEALDVRILLRWMGWNPSRAQIGDHIAADTLVALALATNRHCDTQIDADEILEVFERFCERLRGTAEAEAVCEAIARRLDNDVVFDGCPEITAAFDRWQATRAEATP